MFTNNGNEHCRTIAEEIKKYTAGEYYFLDGELYEDDQDGEAEPAHIAHYLENNLLDYDYIINSQRNFSAVRVCIGFGGPNIFIDTERGTVRQHWGEFSGEWALDDNSIDEINDYFESLYNYC